MILWGAALTLALWLRSAWGVALTGAALLHLALDFPLYHDDGRPHLWPVSDWVFASPVSYWDVDHHAGWVAPVETALAVVLAIWCWTRFGSPWLRGSLALLALAQLSVGGAWAYVFF